MYKTRLWVWLIILILVIGCKEITSIPNNETYYVSVEVSDIETMSKVKNDSRISKPSFCIAYGRENADIIIADHDKEKVIDGYVKYEKAAYTPIVIYAQRPYSSDSGFSVIASNQSRSPSYVDFAKILHAVEKDLTYSSIGLNCMNPEAVVRLMIPDKKMYAFHAVEESIYVSLNDGKVPDDVARNELKGRVDSIIEKCVQSSDITGEIYKVYNMKDKKNPKDILFVSTESSCIGSKASYGVSNSDLSDYVYCPVYIDPCVAVYYDIYVKNTSDIVKIMSQSPSPKYFRKDVSDKIKHMNEYDSNMPEVVTQSAIVNDRGNGYISDKNIINLLKDSSFVDYMGLRFTDRKTIWGSLYIMEQIIPVN